MPMRHLGDHPAGGNLDPELKREVWVLEQEAGGGGRGWEKSEPQAGDGSAAGGSSAS